MDFGRVILVALVFALAGITVSQGSAPTISAAERGLVIMAPGTEPFLLSYPDSELIASVQASGTKAKVRYVTGANLDLEIDGAGVVHYHFSNLPKELRSVISEMKFSSDQSRGGSFRVNDGKTVPFPMAPQAKSAIFAGDQISRLEIHDPKQNSFVLYVPEHSYVDIVDQRPLNLGPYDDGGTVGPMRRYVVRPINGVSTVRPIIEVPDIYFKARIVSPASPEMVLRLGDPTPAH